MANRTIKGVIFERFDDYMARRKRGFKNIVFITELKTEGYNVTKNYFARCLNLAKNGREKQPTTIIKKETIATATAETKKTRGKPFHHNAEPDKSLLE